MRIVKSFIHVYLSCGWFSVYRFAEVVNAFLNKHKDEGKIDINVIHDTSLFHVSF